MPARSSAWVAWRARCARIAEVVPVCGRSRHGALREADTHTQDRGAGTKSRDAKTQGRRRARAMVKWSAARMNPFNKGVAYGMYLLGASYATIAEKVRTVVAERTCFLSLIHI